jgi:2-dehydro-3-deoxyphosphogluconate aldolase / (4S)-4-hydroxy-2-oxoglutarate aldolase
MNKAEVTQRIIDGAIIPVVRAESIDEARTVIDVLVEAGISVVEVTLTVPNAAELIRNLSSAYPSLLVGAGTVLKRDQAAECVDAGAKFIVSPATDVETMEYCRENDIAVMPGALTPTEIVRAWDLGADFVKVFPAGSMGGAQYLRSLKAPLPHIKLIPTGGISLSNAGEFISAGAQAIGVGNDLVDLTAIRDGRQSVIRDNARKYLEIVAAARDAMGRI